jgi:hypothetical protein
MTTPQARPRVVTAAFWIWVVAAVFLVLSGMLLTLSRDNMPFLFRGAGVLFIISALALGYLAGRARAGNADFRRAAVGLALAIVVVLALFTLLTRGFVLAFTLVVFLVMILTMVGAVLMMRPSAHDWFDREETR